MTNPSRLLSWFSGGTRHQRARPIRPRLEPTEAEAEVLDEVVRQFQEAEQSSRLRLDLRKRFRALAKRIAANMAEQIKAAAPKVRPDGGPTGGRLARAVKRPQSVKATGFKIIGGKNAGARLVVLGIKAAETRLREVAVRRLRAEGGAAALERDLVELERHARELERQTRQERARGRA